MHHTLGASRRVTHCAMLAQLCVARKRLQGLPERAVPDLQQSLISLRSSRRYRRNTYEVTC
jgi:hypothetical protein